MADNPAIHQYRVPLRWSDFDRYGHVMNANYVEIAQEARLAYKEAYFDPAGMEDFAAFVRKLDLDFRKPIEPKGNSVLLVESQVVEVGNSSFVTRQEIKDKHGRIACVVETVSVAVDMDTQMPRPLTEEEREVMRLESTLAKAADKAEAESGSAPSAGGVQADSLGDEISYDDDISYGDEVDYGDEVGYGDEVDYGDEIGYDD
ncbi:acyl-CoA thioesterase [Corynebacterium pseudodiphtheriticum]|uniref:acyl-CoA thioesterase n=1 Tax=Corynebacterium pseudodiphtheriticum TaxID=37637 RepID=UPI0032B70665